MPKPRMVFISRLKACENVCAIVRNAALAYPQIIAIQRVVEHVGGVIHRIADQALGIDHQPAAFPAQYVLVVQIAMQRLDVLLIVQEHVCNGRRFDELAVHLTCPVRLSLLEQAGEMRPQRYEFRGEGPVLQFRLHEAQEHIDKDLRRVVVTVFVEMIEQGGAPAYSSRRLLPRCASKRIQPLPSCQSR